MLIAHVLDIRTFRKFLKFLFEFFFEKKKEKHRIHLNVFGKQLGLHVLFLN